MATYSIKWLKNILGTKFFPITHLKAVRDDNNTNLETLLDGKQQTLVSGVNIKTINGSSILGSGNMDVSGGGGGGQANVIESISVNGTPQAVDANKNVDLDVPTKVSDLTNDSGFITGYTETDPVFSASAAANITSSDITNWNGKTSNIGTITSVKMNGTTVSSSGEADLGTVITSHQDISGKADKSATVSTVTYDTTNKKIRKTINGTTTDVVTAATIVTDGGGITSETDPTVPSWAKASSKPSYTASEVGAVPTTRTVNGKALSADITLSASDVSALPSSTAIPSKTSDLTNDSGFLTSADISGVYKYKGSKTNYSNLPSTGNVTGDVWNVVNAYSTYPAGTNFAWDGTTWDALGGSVDLSGYVPTSRTVNGKALSSNISLSASDVSALPSSTYIPTKTSDLTNDSDFITSADIPEGAAASSTTPLMDGTAAVGTETRFARGDHRHPTDTSRQAAITSSSKLSADLIEDGTTNKTVTSTEKSTWNSKGTYSKPSGGIPKTDLASAVQTSLGLADTALQSYTESDPVFTASAAHGISSTDISNWNAKGTYSKPSGGIPKTDLASAVQTSLGKADTALQSYTETDPVFAASVAADITSSDISNWNSKTSNIGTITGITMNGASKGTSGVVDLGTVITEHQDISGKADKATTLAGYGITDAKIASGTITLGSNTITPLTSSSNVAWGNITGTPTTLSGYGITDAASSSDLAGYLPLSGGTMTGIINFVSTDAKIGITTSGNDNIDIGWDWDARAGAGLGLRKVGASSDPGSFRLWARNANNSYTLIGKPDGSLDWGGNLTITGLSVSGTSTLGGYVYMPNQNRIYFKSSGNTDMIAMYQTAANHLYIGYGFADNGYSTYIAGNTVELRYGTSRSTGLTLGSDGNVTATGSVTASSFVGDVTGNASTATTLKTARSIWGQNFDGSSYVRGTLSMFPDSLGMNNDTAKLWFRANTSASGDGYSPYIQGIYQATTGRKRLSVFQINNANYTGTHNEVFTILPDGKVGIGTVTPSTLLHVNGVVTCTSVTQTSDESKKEKIDDINISIENIADAPNITFKWKEGEDKELHGGTIAQYWEDVAPYYVHGDECKTLEYSNLAMSCSIEVAKEVVKLKEENAQLKKELAEIKEMINKLIK